MKKRRLGNSGMVVSEICMGTMTFGFMCDEAESIKIMDRAVDEGIDFFDTAEIYPVPPKAEYMHKTEEIVGRWMKGRNRDGLIIATKVAGPGHGWFAPPLREGKTGLDRHHIIRAVEGSLKRLQTDYIDLYQTHWPDHDMPYEETMEALTELIRAGKVRAVGCSNEKTWGLMKSLWASDVNGTARYQTVQNNFSLLNRRDEYELAQALRKENVSLLPYSPIAGGVLSGKYNSDEIADGWRFSRYAKSAARQRKQSNRFLNDRTLESTAEFMKIAAEIDMSVTTMAVAWSKQHDFVASTIIGATSVEQMDDLMKAKDVELDQETLKKIDAVSERIPYPMG